MKDGASTRWKAGVGSNSKTAALLAVRDIQICDVCDGKGHAYYECSTKKKLDAFAKANDDVADWGFGVLGFWGFGASGLRGIVYISFLTPFIENK